MLEATEFMATTTTLKVVLWVETIGHKMHAAICFLLGFVALNGVIEGQVSRFEIELIFVSFALLSGVIFSVLPPGRLAVITLLTKPEILLQIAMYVFCAQLIRTEVIGLCAFLNGWGLFVYFRKQRRSVVPFTYPEFRKHLVRAEDSEMVARVDKAAGFQGESSASQPPESAR